MQCAQTVLVRMLGLPIGQSGSAPVHLRERGLKNSGITIFYRRGNFEFASSPKQIGELWAGIMAGNSRVVENIT